MIQYTPVSVFSVYYAYPKRQSRWRIFNAKQGKLAPTAVTNCTFIDDSLVVCCGSWKLADISEALAAPIMRTIN